MMLLTKENKKQLPKLYSQENVKDPMVWVKFFTPWTSWTWYATEFDGKDLFFGWVCGQEKELGYFSLRELMSVRGPVGLKIERDRYFRPMPLSEVKRRHASLGAANPALKIPVKSKEQQEHLFDAQSHLSKAGVHFDSGTSFRGGRPRTRDWELDHSLRGATLRNPDMTYVPGKIIYNSWGYDQTNIDFYMITKRSGMFVTLVPMGSREAEHRGVPFNLSMTGTVVPTEVKRGAKPFRRKVHFRDGKESGIAIKNYGWASLWDGKPVHYTSYANPVKKQHARVLGWKTPRSTGPFGVTLNRAEVASVAEIPKSATEVALIRFDSAGHPLPGIIRLPRKEITKRFKLAR